MDDLATLDGRENGIALHDGNAQRRKLREASAAITAHCAAQGGVWEREDDSMTGGGHV